jgi:hypothetical protein
MKKSNSGQEATEEMAQMSTVSRRHFLGLGGGLALAGILATSLGSCKKDKDPVVNNDGTIDLGSGDIGILNYAYALEQLEAAFYTKVAESFASSFSASERALLTDIRDHEVAHREFFKAALGSSAIPGLTPNFSSIDFGDRGSVLATAKAFEDLGVAAYNGAGQLIESSDYLLLAGKIVSVEARHAAYIRDLISPGTFANAEVVDSNGLEMHKSPSQVLAVAANFLTSKISGNNLPTT